LTEDIGDGEPLSSLSCHSQSECSRKSKILVKKKAFLAGVEIAKKYFLKVDLNPNYRANP